MEETDFSMTKKRKKNQQNTTEKKTKLPETFKEPKNEHKTENPEKSNKKLKIVSEKKIATVDNKGTKE